jgi:arylsulfatase A-like enzyme
MKYHINKKNIIACVLMIGMLCLVDIVSAQRKPNVIFFLVDDLGSGEVGSYGSKFHETPNIDALAAQGMKFTTAYSPSTLCSPSRAALMTGRSPARLHLTDWIPGQEQINRKSLVPDWKTYMDKERVLLPEAMKEQGYATFFAGKWHLIPRPTPKDRERNNKEQLAAINAMYEEHLPENNGFDENYGGAHQANQGGNYFYPKYQNFHNMKGMGSPDKVLTDVLTDCAVDFIERKKKEPFFLELSYYAVHGPLTGKPEYVEKYKRKLADNPNADYYMKNPNKAAMLQSVDESVGRLVAKLKEIGQLENTLIIFTSDNGSDGDHYVADFRGNKGTPYEGGTRVPLIVTGPGIKKGISDVPTIGMDIYPTILSYIKAPLKPNEHLDGVDIMPVLSGRGTIADRPLYWHYPHYDKTTPFSTAIIGDSKVIRYADDGKIELYQLKDDVMEKNDLSVKNPEKAKKMEEEMTKLLEGVNYQPALPNPDYDPSKFSGGIREYRRVQAKKKK